MSHVYAGTIYEGTVGRHSLCMDLVRMLLRGMCMTFTNHWVAWAAKHIEPIEDEL